MRKGKSAALILGLIVVSLTLSSCKASGCGLYSSGSSSCSNIVSQIPIITSPAALGNAVEGTPFSVTLTVGGGTAPITWALINATTLPAGLALNAATGVISGTPTGPATGAAVQFQVQATDAKNNVSAPQNASITVFNYPVPSPNLGTLPNGIVNTAYQTTTISVVGGHGPFTLTVTGTPNGMKFTAGTGSAGADITGVATVTNAVTLSGTPTTASANVTITLQIMDSSNPSQTTNVTYTIQILSGPPACPLVGSFAFLMQGFDTNGGAYQVVGSVTVDSAGVVTAGAEDFKSTAATVTNVGLTGNCASGAIPNSGTLALTLNFGNPNTRIYNFVMGVHGFGRIEETDGLPANVSGPIQQQNPSTFANFHGDFAFGMAGNDAGGNRLALAGAFCSNATFQFFTFAIDMTSNGTPVAEVTSSGITATYTAPDSNGRASFTSPLMVTGSNPAVTLTLTFYVVTGGKAFAIETGPPGAPHPIVGGQVVRQAGIHGCAETYNNTSLQQSVITTHGASGGNAYTMLAHVSAVTPTGGNTSTGSAQLVIDQNAGGTVTLLNNNGGTAINANYTVEANGRVTLKYTTTDNKQHTAHAYLYQSAGDAYFVGSDIDSGIGSIRAQSPTTNIAAISGTFAFGTVFTPTSTAVQTAGLLSPSAGNFSAQSGSTTAPVVITPDNNFATTGRATAIATNGTPLFGGTNLVIYAVNPTTLVGMSKDPVTTDNVVAFDQ